MHVVVMTGPYAWGDVMQDLSLPHLISAYWGHIQISIWPFYNIYAIRLIIQCSRSVIFNCIGIRVSTRSCMGYLEIWHGYTFNIFEYQFGSSSHIYPCIANIRPKLFIFDIVASFFYYGDPCTLYILRSRPRIDDSKLVPDSTSNYAPDSSFRF